MRHTVGDTLYDITNCLDYAKCYNQSMPKRLFLASEAKHPVTLKQIDAFVGGYKDKRLVYIPTAGNGEAWGSWKAGGSMAAVQSLHVKLDIIELETYYQGDIISRIGRPDILWMAGGMPGYLLYWLHRLNLIDHIKTLLDQGTVYVGSSAGSMVCSNTQVVSATYLGEADPAAAYLPGLDLIDFEIYPHYDDSQFELIKSKWVKGELRLLKNGEAITVVGETVETLGEERLITK